MKKLLIIIFPLLCLYSCAENLGFTFPSGDGTIIDDDYREVYLGKFNVLARFYNAEKMEYVNVSDGSVIFTVFDKEGERAPGAQVTGLPGIPGVTFTADEYGSFKVSKDLLPKELPATGFTESVTHNGVTESSANNTYVPCKVEVRLIPASVPTLVKSGKGLMEITLELQRKVNNNKGWEQIPSYLGSLSQDIHVYNVYDNGGTIELKEFDSNTNYTTDITKTVDVSSNITVQIERYVKQTYLKGDSDFAKAAIATPVWNGTENYISAQLISYYGESPILDGIIKVAPVQLVPLLETMTATNKQTDATYQKDYFGSIKTRVLSRQTDYYDGVNPYVDYGLLFVQELENDSTEATTQGFTYFYTPVSMAPDDAYDEKVFEISMVAELASNHYGGQIKNDIKISDADATLSHIYYFSSVNINSQNWMFKSYEAGTLAEKGLVTGYTATPYLVANSTDITKTTIIGVNYQ